MSKRSGDFVTLCEVVEEVGRDALRFLMLTRRNDAPLDFDLAQAVAQSRDNPVFYVQYAHARCCSVPASTERGSGPAGADDLARLEAPEELALIRRLAAWPHTVESAAEAHEPHRAALLPDGRRDRFPRALDEGAGRMRGCASSRTTIRPGRAPGWRLSARPAIVIAGGLRTLGVEPVERM